MSLKVFVRAFIALSVIMESRSQNQTDCVIFEKDDKFSFNFLPEDLRRDQTVWENAVRTITNYTNDCIKKLLLRKSKPNCTEPRIIFRFPLISGNHRIPLQVLPRPFLATREASTSTVSQILVQLWKLFVFSLMAAAISGVMIWFLDHKINSGHFPKTFWSGIQAGFWWAIVTMTTVGYGDKTPKSFLGRVYASLWMIIGMLLMSSFTAQISSTITTDGLRPLDEEFGYNIGVPYGSKEFFETYSGGGKLKEYPTASNLLQSLEDGKVDKIWLFDCQENALKGNFKLVKVLGFPPVIGAEFVLVQSKQKPKNKKEFEKCLRRWALNKKSDDDDDVDDDDYKEEEEEEEALLEQVASVILGEKEWESKHPKQQYRCIENHSHGKYQDAKWTSPPTQMGLTDILLCIAGGLLITLLTTGALWDSFVRMRQARKALDHNTDIEKAVGVAQELQSTGTILN